MIYHIRPHQLFCQLKSSSYEERMVKVILPELRTPIFFETAVLLTIAKLVHPRTFFEFGTFLGMEILNLAANLPPETRLYTLDLDEESALRIEQEEYEKGLTKVHMEMRQKLAFLGSQYEQKITRLYGDSNHFDFSRFYGRMDMVYVDGGHALPTLSSDTANAYKMLSQDRAACIAWHDFGFPKAPAVAPFLTELSASQELFHVEETALVFTLCNLPELASKLSESM